MQKSIGGHFELAVWIDVIMSCFFTIIKTVSISCNWTDQLLFTYKMALCTSHSHSFACGWSIVIKFTYLTDIYLAINWWKIQQNIPGRFLEIPVFSRGLFYCAAPCILFITHADGSRVNEAIMRVCVWFCLCVCLSDRRKIPLCFQNTVNLGPPECKYPTPANQPVRSISYPWLLTLTAMQYLIIISQPPYGGAL